MLDYVTTERGRPMKNVLEYLETSAGRYSDKIAVTDEKSSVTYAQLMENSQKIGSFLCDKTDSGEPVIVFMEKSIESLCSFFGTVYAGCFYTLINPQLPDGRITKMREVLGSKTVLTDSSLYDKAKSLFYPLNIYKTEDMLNSPIDYDKLSEIRNRMTDSVPLYINFTSGSSGVPKGVAVSHRSVIDFIDVFCDSFGITEEEIIGNQAPFDFDVSVKDIYSTVKSGASLVIIPKEYFSKPTDLMDYIIDNKVTTLIWAVSALSLINTFHILDYKTPDLIKKVLFSGEVMPLKHLKDWQKHLPCTTFVNLYGPTEITCNCTYHIIDHSADYENGIPIGKAFDNKKVMLLDAENREITCPGVTGEICVGGSGIALGYYNDKEQTEKVFVQNPLNTVYFERIYKTGDLAKYDENGNLFFCGRKDFQIKYLGHRIELEEIEKAIIKIENIETCCCVFDENKKKLYAFYVGSIDKKELHKRLKEVLPVYMVPGALRQMDKLPLNKNGKTDRKALLGDVL